MFESLQSDRRDQLRGAPAFWMVRPQQGGHSRSRRFSDAPINLIARIPTPEQISAARIEKRSFSENLKESGAICFRRVAEMVVQLGQLGRQAVRRGRALLDEEAEEVGLIFAYREPIDEEAVEEEILRSLPGSLAVAVIDRVVSVRELMAMDFLLTT